MEIRTHLYTLALAMLLAATSLARAGEPIAWAPDVFTDPLNEKKKIPPSITRHNPDACRAAPDTRHALSLFEVVTATLCHNPQSRGAYLTLLSSADSYGGAQSVYFPNVATAATESRGHTIVNHKRSNDRSSGLTTTGSMLLYDFGKREATLEAAEQSLISSIHSYDSTLQGFIANALIGYYGLLTSQEAVDVALQSEQFAQESFEAAELRHQIGQAPLADELSARSSYASAILATQEAENSLTQAQSALAILMGMGAGTPVIVLPLENSELLRAPFDDHIEALMEAAKKQRVDLLAQRASLKGAEASLRATYKSDVPTITANAGQTFNDLNLYDRDTGRSGTFSVSVNIPLLSFSGFSETYSRESQRKGVDIARESLVTSELGVEQDVWNSWHSYETARQSWTTNLDLLKSSTQLRDVTLGRYKEGISPILEVLNAQLQYRTALQSNLQARYALLTARTNLIRAVGVLNLDTMQAPETAEAKPQLNDLPEAPHL